MISVHRNLNPSRAKKISVQKRFQPKSVRQRALLKLGTIALSAFLFIMLACSPPPAPPPFSVNLVEGPWQLFPGDSADYTFVADHINEGGLPPESTIEVTILALTGEDQVQQTVTTDARGEFSLNLTMPAQATQYDYLNLQFVLKDQELSGQSTLSLSVAPEISFRHLNQDQAWGAGPMTDMLVQVFDNRHKRPLTDAQWNTEISDGPAEMRIQHVGKTDAQGIAKISIDNGESPIWDLHYALDFTVETDRGRFSTLIQGQKGVESFDVLVSTDKPIYQPGQTIHMRALALLKTSLKAANGQTIRVQLVDPRGTVVSKKEIETSHYGVATSDFPLDSQIGSGDYTLRAETDFGVYTRIVEVKPYTLPRFAIDFASDKPFYAPGDSASGTIDATYFFGKPVTNGTVQITGFAPAAPGSSEKVELFSIAGETNDRGRYDYEFELADTLVGTEVHESVALDLEIQVIDSANHAEQTDVQLIVAQQPLIFEVIAESGNVVTGVENIVYVQASTPDGRPAQEALTVAFDGFAETVTTDQFGLATITVLPRVDESELNLTIQADSLSQKINMPIDDIEIARLLLRPEKAEISVGEPLNLEILVAGDQEYNPNGALVLIQVTKQGYLYTADAVTVQGNRAVATLQLDPTLMGTVEISAQLLPAGGASGNETYIDEASVSDTRLVLVNPSAMQIDATTNSDEYRPGDAATLDIQIAQDGKPLQGLLGISIVDESVFALGAQDPAFARTYFLIDRELTKPHYAIDGFAPFGGEPSPYVGNGRTASLGIQSDAATAISQSQQKALFGLLAQELQWSATAHAAVPNSMGEKGNGAIPVGLLLVAVAIGVGRRNRKETLIAISIILASSILWTACAAGAGAPAAAPAGDAGADSAAEAMIDPVRETGGSVVNEQSTAKPRLRQFFPETLIWLPEVETDAEGRAQINLDIADSITTWRVSVIASDKDGHLGSAQLPMRVFQDFFVEPNLPLYLTEGDEIDVPVSIFNYLDEEQTISLEIASAEWFTVRETADLTINVAANEVASLYIPIRVIESGQGDFQLTATGSAMSDAVLRQVTVAVNGQRQEQVINGTLHDDVVHTLTIDGRAIADKSTITVRFYPSPMSELVSGLEAMLHEPNGCFEQTSSTNYPNVMILDYLRTTEQNAQRIEKRANGFVERGYQRLLTFEVPESPGAFSLWGTPPPQLMLTAYGLMQFTDQSKVTYVDPALIERIASYLSQNQNVDGSWDPSGMMDHGDFDELSDQVVATAYITWALADANVAQSSVERGIGYLQDALEDQQIQSNYGLAMVANAFVAAGVKQTETESVLDQLVNPVASTDEETISWSAGRATYMGGYAQAADIETSDMAAIALMRSGYRLDIAAKAVQGLQDERSAGGYYYSTQATVLVLKAMTLSQQMNSYGDEQATISVMLNGEERQFFDVSAVDQNRPVELTFANPNVGQHELAIHMDGKSPLSYQIVTESHLPWDAVVADSETDSSQNVLFSPALELDVTYSASEVGLNETIDVEAKMMLLSLFPQSNLMAEIGLPPGFRPSAADLEKLVAETAVANYEIRRDSVVLYIATMVPEQEYTFRYRLTAQVPGTVQAPPSFGYPYYASNLRNIDAPQTLVVQLP